MKTGTLDTVSNAATWRQQFEITDAETGDPIDITTDVDEITVRFREQSSGTERLSASLTGGEITVIDTGVFEVAFTVDQMDDLDPKTYEVGATVEIDGDTEQIFLGYLPILQGL